MLIHCLAVNPEVRRWVNVYTMRLGLYDVRSRFQGYLRCILACWQLLQVHFCTAIRIIWLAIYLNKDFFVVVVAGSIYLDCYALRTGEFFVEVTINFDYVNLEPIVLVVIVVVIVAFLKMTKQTLILKKSGKSRGGLTSFVFCKRVFMHTYMYVFQISPWSKC